MVLHQLIVREDVNYISSCASHQVVLMRKREKYNHLRRMRQPHMSKLLCTMRMCQTYCDLKHFFCGDRKFHMWHKWSCTQLTTVSHFRTNNSSEFEVVYKFVVLLKVSEYLLFELVNFDYAQGSELSYFVIDARGDMEFKSMIKQIHEAQIQDGYTLFKNSFSIMQRWICKQHTRRCCSSERFVSCVACLWRQKP